MDTSGWNPVTTVLLVLFAIIAWPLIKIAEMVPRLADRIARLRART